MKKKTYIEKFRKSLNSITVLTLLLPNIMSVGVVAAEELNSDEPQIENVEEIETDHEVIEEPVIEENETPESEEPVNEEELVEETPQDTSTPTQVTPAQVSGIIQENLAYENGTLTLHNQIEGTNIAAVLPNGSLIYAQVPFHGRWSPRQNLIQNKIYVGDEIEFFTYSGTDLGESVFLTVEGEGETRPADQYSIQYSRQHFGFLPTERSSNITYRTEPFFIVEMTFPNGSVETKRSNALGQVRFDFEENNYTTGPGHVFSARVFDRNNNLIDLRDPNLFTDPSRNQVEISIPGDPTPENNTVSIDPNGGTINETYASKEVTEGETYEVPYTFQSGLARAGYTLIGYTVEGTLLDSNGNEVTELSRYTGVYPPNV